MQDKISILELAGELGRLAHLLDEMSDSLQQREMERQDAERRLLDILDLNQKIIAASLVGIVAYDETGQCILANQAAAKIIGATLEQVLAQNFYHLESWKKSGLLQAAQDALASNKARRLEVNVVSTFGKHLWLDCYFTPFTSAGGRRLLLMFSDITQRKQTEINLNALYAITRTTSRSLALTDVLEQTLSSALAFWGFEAGTILLADSSDGRLRLAAHRNLPPALLEYLQSSHLEDTLCAHVYRLGESLIIEDTQKSENVPQEINPLINQVFEQGWRTYAAVPLLHQDQRLGVLSLLAREPRPVSPYDAAMLTTIGHQVATAVANARSFEATLKERGRLQALVKSNRDGIIFLGLDGRILSINRAALNLLHLPGQPEHWQGRRLPDLLLALRRTAPAALSVALTELRQIHKGDEPFREGRLETPPYTVRWVHQPVLAGNAPQGRLVVLYDETEEYALERLRQDMTHTMVHDLRNPLANIIASLQLLTDRATGEISPTQEELLKIALSAAGRMLMLVNAILDVSRLESGQMPLSLQAFDLAGLVAEALQWQKPAADEKELSLENHVPSTLPPVWADVELIKRVLQNLIGNAIKFTPPHGVVRIAAEHVASGPHSKILVHVSDTGPGIPPEIRPRLFGKFVTGRQAGHGSGLGLAFCQLALEAHGEHIWVESTPGQGSTFVFTLKTAQPADRTHVPF